MCIRDIHNTEIQLSAGQLQDQGISSFERWFIGDGFSVEKQTLAFNFKGNTRYLGDLKIHTALKPLYRQSIDFALSRLATNFIRAIPVTLFTLFVFSRLIHAPLLQLLEHINSGALLQSSNNPLRLKRQSWGYQAGDEIDQVSNALTRMSLKLTELRRTLNSVDESIITLDASGYVLQFNQSAKQLLRVRESLQGQRLSDLIRLRNISTQQLIQLSAPNESLLHDSQSLLAGFALEYPDNSHRRVAFALHEVESDSKYQGCVLVLRDITEQLEQEEQLRMSDKMQSLGLLVGGVSHDVNNALASILSAAELLKHNKDIQQVPRAECMIDVIISSANSTSGLLKRLLAFSAGETDVIENVNLSALLQELVTLIECTTPDKVGVHYHCQLENAIIQGAPSSIESAVLNLSINAVTAMNAEGKISITLKAAELRAAQRLSLGLLPEPDYACIEVCDTGCGMDSKTLGQIFDPFFTTRPNSGGTGLGLSMVYRTLQDHQGAIEVKSELGKGTCFSLYIPTQKSTTKPALAKHTQVDGNQCYLIVDDEPRVRELLCQTLESRGNRVLQAENGQQALELWQRHQSAIDLVISDLNMPLMDGVGLCTALKAQCPSVEIIVSSGYINASMKKHLEQLGIQRWLNKPYTLEQLEQVLNLSSKSQLA